ncbi:hypothetical protein [uncultured Prevotella sp.]|uniref:hypothetical protein n=1 Tax=uncultured Prevotella sp. TaxID=159272 RepID=UPI0026019F72|nr:hypothetical protein [uncultured Prevotella sp.]
MERQQVQPYSHKKQTAPLLNQTSIGIKSLTPSQNLTAKIPFISEKVIRINNKQLSATA